MDIITLALAKKYVDEVVAGSGVRAGKNCTIQSITPVDGGNNVVFAWTNDDGTAATQTLFVANGVDGTNGIDGADGVSVTHSWNGTILEVTSASGTSSADLKGETGAAGAQGLRGEKGDKGETGAQGIQGIQGIQGEKGEDGYPFLIYKEYADISEFNANDFPEIGLMFMINDGVTGSDKPVYRYTGDADNPYTHVTDMATAEGLKGEKGDKGDQGEQGVAGANGVDGADGTTYTPQIGTITTVDSAQQAAASVRIDEETKRAIFDFSIPKGEAGQDGADAPQIDDDTTSAEKVWSSSKVSQMLGGERSTVLTFDNARGSDVKWYKICPAISDSKSYTAQMIGQRINTTAEIEYLSLSCYYEKRYAFNRLLQQVYSSTGGKPSREEANYFVIDADWQLLLCVASYSVAQVELLRTLTGLVIDGTETTAPDTTTLVFDGYSAT